MHTDPDSIGKIRLVLKKSTSFFGELVGSGSSNNLHFFGELVVHSDLSLIINHVN